MEIKATDIYVSKSTEQIDIFRRSDLKYSGILKPSNSSEIGQVVHSGLYDKEYDGIKWESSNNYEKIREEDWGYVVVVIEMENKTYVSTPYWDYERAPEIYIKDTTDFEEIGKAIIKAFDYCKRVIKENS
ncbi:hypothetical protein [Dokdonia sp.]|uniref:hypothetical protein n=1 Tax=Dokdonia sp. TaxID=2024995 RepID=UPI003266BDAA